MFRNLSVLLALTFAAALSGCADDPPQGTFSLSPGPADIEGTVEVSHQEFRDPLGVAQGPDEAACTARPPEAGQSCVPPESSFNVGLAQAPAPDPNLQYTAFFVGTETLEIGTLEGTDMGYAVNQTFDQYLGDDAGARVEIRLGDVVVASAPATEGIQNFELNPELRQVTGDGSFNGPEFTVDVQGLPQNGTYVGWFVQNGTEHVVSFPISEGENTYTADGNVAEYGAFHIHLGASKVNVAVADMGAPEEDA